MVVLPQAVPRPLRPEPGRNLQKPGAQSQAVGVNARVVSSRPCLVRAPSKAVPLLSTFEGCSPLPPWAQTTGWFCPLMGGEAVGTSLLTHPQGNFLHPPGHRILRRSPRRRGAQGSRPPCEGVGGASCLPSRAKPCQAPGDHTGVWGPACLSPLPFSGR